MTGCLRCGSAAINPFSQGRDPAKDRHLCDVCYWRERADDCASLEEEADQLRHERDMAEQSARDMEAECYDLQADVERLERADEDLRAQHDYTVSALEAQIEELQYEIRDLKA